MMEATMTFKTTPEFVDAAGTCLAHPSLGPRRNAVAGPGMPGSIALIVTCAICAIVSCSVIARADPLRGATNPWPAPIGHAQPRANNFSPSSQAEQAVQGQLSAFDVEQKKLDEKLDKTLNICRC
jgi:hypothetical protein